MVEEVSTAPYLSSRAAPVHSALLFRTAIHFIASIETSAAVDLDYCGNLPPADGDSL